MEYNNCFNFFCICGTYVNSLITNYIFSNKLGTHSHLINKQRPKAENLIKPRRYARINLTTSFVGMGKLGQRQNKLATKFSSPNAVCWSLQEFIYCEFVFQFGVVEKLKNKLFIHYH